MVQLYMSTKANILLNCLRNTLLSRKQKLKKIMQNVMKFS